VHGGRRRSEENFANSQVDADMHKTVFAAHRATDTNSNYNNHRVLQADVLKAKSKQVVQAICTEVKVRKKVVEPDVSPSKNKSGLTDEEIVAHIQDNDVEPVTVRGIRIVEKNPEMSRRQTLTSTPRVRPNTQEALFSAPMPVNNVPTG
jgi:hypothetical protein